MLLKSELILCAFILIILLPPMHKQTADSTVGIEDYFDMNMLESVTNEGQTLKNQPAFSM